MGCEKIGTHKSNQKPFSCFNSLRVTSELIDKDIVFVLDTSTRWRSKGKIDTMLPLLFAFAGLGATTSM